MAGSYGHVNFVAGSWSLIENMGDAHECVEELLWLVGELYGCIRGRSTDWADLDGGLQLLLDRRYYPMCRGEKPPDAVLQRVQQIMSSELLSHRVGDDE
jgi:hypothetical protein